MDKQKSKWRLKYYHPHEVVYSHPKYGDLHVFKLMTTSDLWNQKGYFSKLLAYEGIKH